MRPSTLFAVASAASLLAFTPMGAAFAQDDAATPPPAVSREAGNWTLKQREDWLDSRINKAHDDHSIDDHEADRIHHELDHIRHEEGDFRGHQGGQLTNNETTELEARLDQVAATIHWLHDNSFQRPW